MCLQCSAMATTLRNNVVPGFTLMISTESAEGWPKGTYGLVECNDPSFVFEGPLLLNPIADLSDEAVDALPRLPEGFDEYIEAVDKLRSQLRSTAETGYRFVMACARIGYDPEGGEDLAYWLLHHLAKSLQSA